MFLGKMEKKKALNKTKYEIRFFTILLLFLLLLLLLIFVKALQSGLGKKQEAKKQRNRSTQKTVEVDEFARNLINCLRRE